MVLRKWRCLARVFGVVVAVRFFVIWLLGLSIDIPFTVVGIQVIIIGLAILHVIHVIECLELRLELIKQRLLRDLLRLYLLDELLLLLFFRFDYFLGVVDFVDFAVHFIFVEVILRRIGITSHGLIAALIISLISLLDLDNLVRALQLIFLKEVAPFHAKWVLAQLAKDAGLASSHVAGAFDTNLRNRRI